MLEGITLNGVPLKQVVRAAESLELKSETEKEVRSMKFIVSRSRAFPSSRHKRNISGARSGKGRVIFSKSWQ